ncbi:MAG: hypothetical protein CL908_25335 [Deltaproteobacteria bacterium]|nr:hypothetical protein [Deltaproteobacteria bacterium]
MSEAAEFFLSRQPIVAGERRLMGWELAFGSPAGQALTATEEHSGAYLDAVLEFSKTASWDSLLCGGRAVLPIDRRLVFSGVLDLMPRNRMLLALSPCALGEIDKGFSNRLYKLYSRRGARLLFLDYQRRDPREQLLDLAEVAQIDAFGQDAEARQRLVRRAQRRNLKVLASSVEQNVDFVRIRDSGFDLLLGQSYSEPSDDEETQATPDGRVLIQLLVEARGELEVDLVTRRVEENEELRTGLLRLVNSLELARSQKIESISQALILVGAQGLSRWLNLLLFQVGSHHGTQGPLFRVAASRARLMELLVTSRGADDPGSKERSESAFLVGILSLVHVLLGTDRKTAIAGLTLPDEMGQALTDYKGELGRLLRMSECLDGGQFAELAEIVSELGIGSRALWSQQCEAYDWVMKMI